MHKGYFFDLLTMNNGFSMTIFRIFKFAIKKEDEGYGPYILFQLGIWKFELNISLVWRAKYHEENTKAQT